MGTTFFIPRRFGLTLFGQSKRCFNVHSVAGPTPEEMISVRKDLYDGLLRDQIPGSRQVPLPEINNPAVKAKRSALFTKEKERQLREVGRIQKITVQYDGLPKPQTFLMNKFISTPFDCTRHINDTAAQSTVAAEVDGRLWDMHKPLESDCKIKLLSMKSNDDALFQINRIFWRSCTMMLGAVLEKAFRDHIYIELHSYPSPNVRSGSFLYDVDIKIPNWVPNSDEMRVFSAEMIKLSHAKLPFERLEVSTELALEMFADNKYKREQIPEISKISSTGNSLVLYRIGDFVDISRGPMMSNTDLLGKCTITRLFPLEEAKDIAPTLYRVQGVAIPNGFHLNHFAYSLIESRGKKPNPARFLGLQAHDARLLPEGDQPSEQRVAIAG